jgi:uncharacterized protein (DUF697 family)
VSVYKATLKRALDDQSGGPSEEEKSRAVKELIHTSCAAATVATLQPVPFLDPFLITPIQIGMVQGIGYLRGYHLDKKSVLEILRTLRASLVTQQLSIAVAKFVPAVGWVASISMAYALTYAVGELSDRYFRGGRSMLPAEMRAIFKAIYKDKFRQVYDEKRKEWKVRLHGPPEIKERLRDIDRARREGSMSGDEAERRKLEILSHA